MKVRLEYVSFYLLIGTILLAIGLADAFTCPEQCSCIEVQRTRYNYNHAKCTSLEGLRQLGKTSDLHSLDLSSMNLTKINNQLDKLTNLSRLDLSENHLSEISNLSQKRIRILNMSGNRITSGKLAKIPTTVKHLNLSNNDITILTETFKRFIHLKSLELAENPLNCTCETLDVRNWLQEHKVWTEKPIRCMAPLQFKGRSWLQIRQSEVCDPNGLETPRTLPFSDGTDDENDLMMLGDDPNAGQSKEHLDDDDRIEDDFIPVINDQSSKTDQNAYIEGSTLPTELESIEDDLDDEGSGSEPIAEASKINHPETTEISYEGSGDIDEATEETSPVSIALQDNELINSNETTSNEDSTNSNDLLIAQIGSNVNTTENENDSQIVTEQPIVPVKSAVNDAELIDNVENDAKHSESTKIDEVQESKSTYILLAVLGVLLVVLILWVATKRRTNPKNRRNNNDIENPAQELLTMDKNNLGKPIQSPVEFIPLIPDKHESDKKQTMCNGEEPLLQKLTEVENENDNNEPNVDDKQNPVKQLNGNAKPIQNGVHSNPDKNDEQKEFQPISPKPSRYSPVSLMTF